MNRDRLVIISRISSDFLCTENDFAYNKATLWYALLCEAIDQLETGSYCYA